MSQCACPNCQGSGELRCPNCYRSQRHEDIFDQMFGRFGRACGECGGSQKVECRLCNGRGTIYAYKGG
jgi:hypothetical protein